MKMKLELIKKSDLGWIWATDNILAGQCQNPPAPVPVPPYCSLEVSGSCQASGAGPWAPSFSRDYIGWQEAPGTTSSPLSCGAVLAGLD